MMTDLQKLVERLAKEACEEDEAPFVSGWVTMGRGEFERFAQLVAEACAKVCETMNHGAFGSSTFLQGIETGAIGCANAIRERFKAG